MRRILGLALVLCATAVLTGCAVTASTETAPHPSHRATAPSSPSPTPSIADPMVLSTDGLGPLRMGSPVPADQDVVTWDANACPATEDGSATIGMWKPTVPLTGTSPLERDAPFGIVTKGQVEDAPITFLQVWSSQYRTPSGLRVGSTNADVRAALPGATMIDTGLSQEYAVSSGGWRINFTVADSNSGPVRDDSVVQVISVDSSDGPQLTFWATDGGAVCAP